MMKRRHEFLSIGVNEMLQLDFVQLRFFAFHCCKVSLDNFKQSPERDVGYFIGTLWAKYGGAFIKFSSITFHGVFQGHFMLFYRKTMQQTFMDVTTSWATRTMKSQVFCVRGLQVMAS